MQNQTQPKPSGAPMAKMILVVAMIISLGAALGIIGYVLTRQKSIITPAVSPPKTISAIELSADAKSILNAETKGVIFTIDDANKYLKDSGYAYDSDTFQDTNAKYAGDCFLSAALSNNKDMIVFSAGCLAGDFPQVWVGVYERIITDTLKCSSNSNNYFGLMTSAYACIGEQDPRFSFRFLVGGSGRDFTWSADDETITYEADLGLSGLTETRTIDAMTGEILEKTSNIKTGKGEIDDGVDIVQLQSEIDEGDQAWKKLYIGPCHGDCGQTEFSKFDRLNPDLVLQNLKIYGFNDEDIKNAKEVSSESGIKVYEIQHKTNYYIITLSQPVIGTFKAWIISEIESKKKVCQPKLVGIKIKNEGANRIFEEKENKLYPIISTDQFTKNGYKMYCVNWYYLDELPDAILDELPESDFSKNLKTINTANWNLYKNEEIKLSFSHPEEWNVRKGMGWGDKWAEPFYYLGPFNAGPMTVKEIDMSYRSGMWGLNNIGSITINGQKTFMLESDPSGSGNISYYTKLYISGHDFYVEYIPEYGSEDNNKENESIFSNVLSTFKSFESSRTKETEGWKTFKSEKDGFEIEYPDSIMQSGYVIINGSYQYIWAKTDSLNPFITITVKSLEGLSIEKWLVKNKIKTSYGKENIVLENSTFLKYYDAEKGFYDFYSVKNNKVYIITLTERDDIIKKILSTFKFIELEK
ncbi:MAG: hypothetical protein WA063_01620 [Minisyncoccia bacterium]